MVTRYRAPYWKDSIQRGATKLISQLKDKIYEERLRELGLPSLVYRRRRGDMIFMFKISNGLLLMDISAQFSPTRFGHTRGHTQKIYKNHAVKAFLKEWSINGTHSRITSLWHLHSIRSKKIRRSLVRHPLHHRGI